VAGSVLARGWDVDQEEAGYKCVESTRRETARVQVAMPMDATNGTTRTAV